MRKPVVPLLRAVTLFSFFLCIVQEARSKKSYGTIASAVCVLDVGTDTSGVSGTLLFKQIGDVVTVSGVVTGLKPNTEHGFHVHEKGDVRNGCNSTGDHFNQFHKNHGGPLDMERHVGDTGNIVSDVTGKAVINIQDRMLSLSGKRSIIGRGYVVHEGRDDLGRGGTPLSLKNGNAGARVACGIIGIM